MSYSCAHQSSPGGGPEDTTPPEISNSYPEAGQVNVDPEVSIRFSFSEWINSKSVQKAVTLYPSVREGVEIKVSGNTLVIDPKEPFKDNTTYHVSISTSLQDLRGNSIEKPIDLVFSTGSALDSAQLSGCVLSPSPLLVLPKVTLYLHDSTWSDSVFYSNPDYMTQTDSTGFFHFSNLKKGNYRIVAFHDKDNDGKLDIGDPSFSSVDKTIRVRSIPKSVELYPVDSDSLPPSLKSVRAVDRYVLRCSWTKKFDSERFSSAQWSIKTKSPDLKAPTIKETVYLKDEQRFFLLLKDSLQNGTYQLNYSFDSESDSARFSGTDKADTAGAELISFSPRGASSLSADVRLFWSKPVRPTQSIYTAQDSTGDSVSLFSTNRYSDTTVLTPSRRLGPGKTYEISIPLRSIKDISGNNPVSPEAEDSSITVRLSTVAADSLCYLMQGGADCFSHNKQRKWMYQPFGRLEKYTVKDSAGHFTYDSLPAGKGFLSWFIDTNGDNRPTAGRLVPWKAPEPHVVVADTVEARARWEIENIQLNACDPCARPEQK
ncbi:MAG: Ig-like domain-containing protein [Chitinispirillaceae bacterium]